MQIPAASVEQFCNYTEYICICSWKVTNQLMSLSFSAWFAVCGY